MGGSCFKKPSKQENAKKVAYLQIGGSVVGILYAILLTIIIANAHKSEDLPEEVKAVTPVYVMFYFLAGFIQLVFGIILLNGVKMRNAANCKAWLIFEYISIPVFITYLLVSFFYNMETESKTDIEVHFHYVSHAIKALAILFHIYLVILVYRFKVEIESGIIVIPRNDVRNNRNSRNQGQSDSPMLILKVET